MDIDNITDVNELRRLLKTHMVRLEKTIETPTHTYKAGEWFFFTQDEDGVFLYEEDSMRGVMISYDEADEIIDCQEQ